MKRNFLFFISFITFIIICFCKKGEIHIQEEKNANNFIKAKLEKKIKKSSNEKKNLKNKIEVKVIEKKSNEPDISLQPKIPSFKQRKNNLYPI